MDIEYDKGIKVMAVKYAAIALAVFFMIGILLFIAYRILSSDLIGMKDDTLCLFTGLGMYCDPEGNEHASEISNQIGNPYDDGEDIPEGESALKIRSIVQRFYEAVNKPAFQEFDQLEDEICPLYEDMLKLDDDELREVAFLYRKSYAKTLRKEIGETFFECSAVRSFMTYVSPVMALYNAITGVDNPGQDLLDRMNELQIP